MIIVIGLGVNFVTATLRVVFGKNIPVIKNSALKISTEQKLLTTKKSAKIWGKILYYQGIQSSSNFEIAKAGIHKPVCNSKLKFSDVWKASCPRQQNWSIFMRVVLSQKKKNLQQGSYPEVDKIVFVFYEVMIETRWDNWLFTCWKLCRISSRTHSRVYHK